MFQMTCKLNRWSQRFVKLLSCVFGANDEIIMCRNLLESEFQRQCHKVFRRELVVRCLEDP